MGTGEGGKGGVDGITVGLHVGSRVVGLSVGVHDGVLVGDRVGLSVGVHDGVLVGDRVG